MEEKLIRDTLGRPVPQRYNEDINFSQTKLLRDQLGSVIPQLWDAQNNKWVVMTAQNTDGNSGNGQTIHTSIINPTSADGADGDLWIKHKEVLENV